MIMSFFSPAYEAGWWQLTRERSCVQPGCCFSERSLAILVWIETGLSFFMQLHKLTPHWLPGMRRSFSTTQNFSCCCLAREKVHESWLQCLLDMSRQQPWKGICFSESFPSSSNNWPSQWEVTHIERHVHTLQFLVYYSWQETTSVASRYIGLTHLFCQTNQPKNWTPPRMNNVWLMDPSLLSLPAVDGEEPT